MRLTVSAWLLAAAVLAPAAARADRRYYGETYNAVTAPKGALDLELWSTFYKAPKSGGVDSWLHQLELETGLTDRWDVALYGIYRTANTGLDSGLHSMKVETRYRVSDPDTWPLDTVLYLEGRKEFLDDRPWAVEEKVIVGKDIGPLNLSGNVLAEQEWPAGGGNEVEYGYAAGASYELTPMLRLGGEVYGTMTRSVEGAWDRQHYVGPAVSIAVARSWLVLAAGFGLTDQSDRLQGRAILAFQF
jgi:hypothetical protein